MQQFLVISMYGSPAQSYKDAEITANTPVQLPYAKETLDKLLKTYCIGECREQKFEKKFIRTNFG